MNSDSDSDDDLQHLQVFVPTRRKRTADKKVAKGFSILDEAMRNADQMKENDDRIALIKQEENERLGGHENNEALMAKVEETIANAKKQPTAASQQRDREDAIAGSVEDLEQVLGRTRCLELGRAFDTDAVAVLGARPTMAFDPKRRARNDDNTTKITNYFDTAMTSTAYIQKLRETLRKLVSSKRKILQVAWIQPLRKKSQDVGTFRAFLETRMLVKARQEQESLQEVPEEILLWLLRVSCSDEGNTERIVVPFREGATKTLLGLLRQNKLIQLASSITNQDNVAKIRPACFALSQFAVQLQCWAVHQVVVQKDGDQKDDKKTQSPRNTRGLQQLLILWNAAFDSDQVTTGGSEETARDATRCLRLLAKLGLDRDSVHSTKMNFQLVHHLKCIMSQILLLVSQKLGTETRWLSFTKDAAVAIVEELVNSNLGLGPGDDDAEDADDPNAWLSLALTCRMLPTMARTHKRKSDCQFQKTAAQFKAMVCMQALEHMFRANPGEENGDFASSNSSKPPKKNAIKSPPSWEKEVYATVARYQKAHKDKYDLVEKAKSDLRWLTLCSTLTALVKVNGLRGAVDEDKPKCLAIIEVALGRCLDVGMELMKDVETDENDLDALTSDASINEYKTAAEARGVAILLGHVKLESTQLAARMNASMMTPHFRRVGYLLQCHSKYFMDAQHKAAHHGGDRAVVQDTLDRWINKDKVGVKMEDETDEVPESPRKKQRSVLSPMDNRA